MPKQREVVIFEIEKQMFFPNYFKIQHRNMAIFILVENTENIPQIDFRDQIRFYFLNFDLIFDKYFYKSEEGFNCL